MAKTIEEGGFFSLSEAKHKAQEKLNFKKKFSFQPQLDSRHSVVARFRTRKAQKKDNRFNSQCP